MKGKLLSYSKESKNKSLIDKILFWRKSKEERLIDNLNKYYKKEKKYQFYNPSNLPWIINGLEREMSMVIAGKQEQMRVSLYVDSDYLKAVEILKDANKYYDILSENSFEQ